MIKLASFPRFEPCVLSPERESGYWASFVDLERTGRPDILAFGVRAGPVELFHNPFPITSDKDDVPTYGNGPSAETCSPPRWSSTKLDTPEGPVAATYAPLLGEFPDIVIATRFGGGLASIDDTGGQLVLYANPKNEGRPDSHWSKFEIGQLAGTHRVWFGHFTTMESIQLLAVPITSKKGDAFAPVTLTLFQPKSNGDIKAAWESESISSHTYSVVHDVAIGRYRKCDQLDSIVVASNEGLTWVYYDIGEWKREVISEGLDLKSTGHISVGSGSDIFSGYQDVAIGKLGDDSTAFIAASGPFHGNVIRIHVKVSGNVGDLTDAKWEAYSLHTFDEISPVVDGSGGVHQIAAVDLDGDGDDEVVIAHKFKGVYVARVADITRGIFQLSTVSTAPASRIDFADVDGNGHLDIVTLGDSFDTEKGSKPATLVLLKNLGS